MLPWLGGLVVASRAVAFEGEAARSGRASALRVASGRRSVDSNGVAVRLPIVPDVIERTGRSVRCRRSPTQAGYRSA